MPFAAVYPSGRVYGSAGLSWLPAAGEVVAASTNTLDAAAGRTATGIWQAWSGVGYAPWWGQYGTIVIAGGGHVDGAENDIYGFDPATRLITKIKNAAPIYYKPDTDVTVAQGSTGWMWANSTLGDTTVQTGQLGTSHEYASLLCVPPGVLNGVTGDTYGCIYHMGRTGMPTNFISGPTGSFVFRLGVGVDEVWQTHGLVNQPTVEGLASHGVGQATCYDSLRNVVWARGPTYNDRGWYRELGSDSDQTPVTVSYTGSPQGTFGYGIQEYSATHDCVMRLCERAGTSPKQYTMIQVWDVDTQTFYEPAQSGTPIDSPHLCWAACWSEEWGAFAMITGMTGQNKVWFCKPSGDPRTTTWVWSSQTITSGTLLPAYDSAGDERPSFNRLRHFAALGDVLIWCSKTNAVIQAIGVTPP